MDLMRWPAPAKINLFLHIVGRRDDGYHLLQTAFQFIDYCDYLTFHLRDDGRILRLNPLPGVPEDEDLTVRAARLLQAQSGVALGVDIGIDKRLPMGGGIGGGSSDAATTLVALNHMWQLGFNVDRLAALGLALGADVPVFVRGRAAWAEGVGEHLHPIDPPEPYYLILVPDCHVSTAAIFGDPDLTRDEQTIKIAAFLEGAPVGNSCEALVRRRYPAVDEALRWLNRFGEARMSGTGACVFAPFVSEEDAQRVMAQMPVGWKGFVAKGLNHSPLQQHLARCGQSGC